jgi:transketolase
MPSKTPEPMATAAFDALANLREEWPNLAVILGTGISPAATRLLRRSFGAALQIGGSRADLLSIAERRRRSAGPTVVVVPSLGVGGMTYEAIRDRLGKPRLPVKLIAQDGGAVGPAGRLGHGPIEDLGLMATIPAMTVVAPADAASARAAVKSIIEIDGPAYLRLASGDRQPVSNGSFSLGVWPSLRPGNDLTLIAVGASVARAVSVADELKEMGLTIRVLDAASVKPMDTRSILRAASETGALVVLEDHGALAGVGSQVAATVSADRPVRVARLAIPDLFAGPVKDLGGLDRYGLSQERVVETCLDLLRQRGKV